MEFIHWLIIFVNSVIFISICGVVGFTWYHFRHTAFPDELKIFVHIIIGIISIIMLMLIQTILLSSMHIDIIHIMEQLSE